MATLTEVRKICDLCGYTGTGEALEDFKTIGDVDLCRWCRTPKAQAGSTLVSGRHTVTFTEGSWTCRCGADYERLFLTPLEQRVRDAVPDLATAVAVNHVQGR